jgi:outer membrane receptor for ferrienterochelin and colicins
MMADWTGRVVGPMALPRHPGRAARSPWFSEQNLQVTRRIVGEAFLILGVKNLFDTRQDDPLVAPDDPFGPDFDTNFVWGPTQGRRVIVGFQWNAAR